MKLSLLGGADMEGGAHERVTAHQDSLTEGLSSDESMPPSAWRAFQSTEGRRWELMHSNLTLGRGP